MYKMVEHALLLFPVGGILFVIGFAIWQRRQERQGKKLFPQPASLPSYRDMLPQLQKELSRARRLERPLSVVVIRSGTPIKDANSCTDDDLNGLNQSEFLLSGPIGPIFGRAFRDIDCATYDGTSKQYVIVLPETTKPQAIQLVKRLNRLLGEKLASRLAVGLSEFPSDALCLEDLVFFACRGDAFPGNNYELRPCDLAETIWTGG